MSALEDGSPDELLISQGCHQEVAQSCILEHEGANNCASQSASTSGHLVGRDCLDSSEVGRIHSEPNGSDSGPNGRNVPSTSAGALVVSARFPYTDFRSAQYRQQASPRRLLVLLSAVRATAFQRVLLLVTLTNQFSMFVSVPYGTG